MSRAVGLVGHKGDFEHHQMPREGYECFYRDSDHSYWGEVKPVTKGRGEAKKVVGYSGVAASRIGSPSSIAKYTDPDPDRLMDYAAKRELEGMGRLLTDVIQGTPLEELPDALDWVGDLNRTRDMLNTNQLSWRHDRGRRGKDGTITHWAFENGLKGIRTKPEDAPETARGHVQGVNDFLAEYSPELLQGECVVFSKEHNYAGRFDALVNVKGERWLLDLKTSGYIGRSYHAQLQGYDLAAEECGYGAADRILIVQTLPEPDERGRTFYLWPARSSRGDFLHALALYEAGKETDKVTKADWQEVVAA